MRYVYVRLIVFNINVLGLLLILYEFSLYHSWQTYVSSLTGGKFLFLGFWLHFVYHRQRHLGTLGSWAPTPIVKQEIQSW